MCCPPTHHLLFLPWSCLSFNSARSFNLFMLHVEGGPKYSLAKRALSLRTNADWALCFLLLVHLSCFYKAQFTYLQSLCHDINQWLWVVLHEITCSSSLRAIQYNCIWHWPSSIVCKCTWPNDRTSVAQSYCDWRTCSMSLHSDCLRQDSNPDSPRYRPSLLTNRPSCHMLGEELVLVKSVLQLNEWAITLLYSMPSHCLVLLFSDYVYFKCLHRWQDSGWLPEEEICLQTSFHISAWPRHWFWTHGSCESTQLKQIHWETDSEWCSVLTIRIRTYVIGTTHIIKCPISMHVYCSLSLQCGAWWRIGRVTACRP